MCADLRYLFQVDKPVIKGQQILKKKVTERACVFDRYITVTPDCGNWAGDVLFPWQITQFKKKKKKFL